jgi:hypothetical protein
MKQLVLTYFCLILLFNTTFAQRYHLFKPVPRAQLREFALDRPDVTESPQTVDAGHFQFEGDVVKWIKQNGGVSKRTVNIWSGLYKIGISENFDFHVIYEAYNINQDNDGKKIDEGAGVLTFRMKKNLWGNNGDKKTGFGLLPYVTFTSGDPFVKNQDVIFGLGFPFSTELFSSLEVGLQPQIDFIPDENGNYTVGFFQSVMIGSTIVGNLDYFAEAVFYFLNDGNQYLLNGGLIYNVTPNVKIDLATNVGLNTSTPTRAYLGLSFRI